MMVSSIYRRPQSPDVVKKLLQLGQAHLQRGRLEQAVACFVKVLRWCPSDFHANIQLGYINLHKGELEQALHYTNVALKKEPKNVYIWAQLIAILRQTFDRDLEEKAQDEIKELDLPLDRILEISKSVLVPPHKRVESLIEILNQKNLINTEIAARLFIENYPDHPLGWQILGEVLHDCGQFDEALEVKRTATEKFPEDANVYNNLARTLLALQDYEGTKLYAKKALKIDPNHKNAAYHLLKAETALGKTNSRSRRQSSE